MKPTIKRILLAGCAFALLFQGCGGVKEKTQKERLSLFVGMDISGSFVKGAYFEDGIDFLSHYLYAHLNGLGGLEKPNVLFVGSIGGAKENQPKTFYPIQTFQNMSVDAIAETEDFSRPIPQSIHRHNAFSNSRLTVKNKNLLRGLSRSMISDGRGREVGGHDRHPDHRSATAQMPRRDHPSSTPIRSPEEHGRQRSSAESQGLDPGRGRHEGVEDSTLMIQTGLSRSRTICSTGSRTTWISVRASGEVTPMYSARKDQ
jgi:hypothetical protein